MAGIRIAKVAKVSSKSATATASHSTPTHREWNGKGGFKPGNQYGKRTHSLTLSSGSSSRQGSLFGARPERPNVLGDKLKEFKNDRSHIEIYNARAAGHAITEGASHGDLTRAMVHAGIKHDPIHSVEQLREQIKSIHTPRIHRQIHLDNAREIHSAGWHRTTDSQRLAFSERIGRSSNDDLIAHHNRLTERLSRPIDRSALNAGERAVNRGRLRAIEHEQTARESARVAAIHQKEANRLETKHQRQKIAVELRQQRSAGGHRSASGSHERFVRNMAENTDAQIVSRMLNFKETYRELRKNHESPGSSAVVPRAGIRAKVRRKINALKLEIARRREVAAELAANGSRQRADADRLQANRTMHEVSGGTLTPTNSGLTKKFVMPKHGITKAKVELGSGTKASHIREATIRIFGKPVSPRRLATMAGSPDDSTATIQVLAHEISVATESGKMSSSRYFRTTHDGKPEIYNAHFRVHGNEKGNGIGASVFGREVEYASKAGVSQIKVSAARGGDYIGYYVWARFGYKGPIPSHVKFNLPSHLSHASQVEELMATKEGTAWWKEHGDNWGGKFELDPKGNTESMKLWRAYNIEKSGLKAEKAKKST